MSQSKGMPIEALVAPMAVIQQIGLVEIVDRQFPLGGIFIQRLEEALCREVAEPGREELQRVEAGVAGEELGHDLVVH